MNANDGLNMDKADLERTLADAGYRHTLVKLENTNVTTMLTGELCFDHLPSGLRIHCTDIVEKQEGKSTSMVSPGISINFLLIGDVDFALADKQYFVSSESQPQIFVNVLSEEQLFTRFFHQDKRIKKLNISIDRAWIEARCHHLEDQLAVANLFAQKQAVYQWSCDSTCMYLVKELFNAHNKKTVTDRLKAEQIAFDLFTQCYQKLMDKVTPPDAVKGKAKRQGVPRKKSYEHRIETMLYEHVTLDQMAKRLGASISSLQRYFKANHQLTLKEYVRYQKLEHARRSLIFDQQSIGEVSYRAGYNHVSNFVTAFKKRFNITPAQLIKQHDLNS